jgi:hypothetical protein
MAVGIRRAAVRWGFGVRLTTTPQRIIYRSTPAPANHELKPMRGARGIGNFSEPALYRSTTKIVWMGGGGGRGVMTYRPKMLYSVLRSGILGRPAKAAPSARIDLALDVYAASFFERSPQARFITLVGVLEVLKDQRRLSRRMRTLVQGWLKQLQAIRGRSRREDEALRSLVGQVRRLEQESINKAIQNLVSKHLGRHRAQRAATFYGIRSRYVHDGVDEGMRANVLELQALVKDLLWKLV